MRGLSAGRALTPTDAESWWADQGRCGPPQPTAPAHIRRVAELFVARLDDEELAVMERALKKVTLNCTFG